MTCASCAHRIERKLNKLDGVDASVSYASERAHVRYPAALATQDLIERPYAAPATTPRCPPQTRRTPTPPPVRLLVAAVLSVPVVALGMVPGAAVRRLGVVVAAAVGRRSSGGAAGRSTGPPAVNARHGASTMDTLVSLGTVAAWIWSAVAVRARRGPPLPRVARPS